jgi:hypothetical protein
MLAINCKGLVLHISFRNMLLHNVSPPLLVLLLVATWIVYGVQIFERVTWDKNNI